MMSFAHKGTELTKLNFVLITAALMFSGLHAAEVEALRSQIADYNKAATEMHLNQAYKPYIVTVVNTDEMEMLGVSTLKEALTIVAGLDVHTNELNDQSMVIRGSNPNAYGQTQLFVDGVLVNNVIYDGYNEYLRMPIELIKRIEVVRGNGAEISVFNPYSGMIRVITYAEHFPAVCEDGTKGSMFGRYSSLPSSTGGGGVSYQEDKLFYHLDAYYYENDETEESGPDAASTGRFDFPALGIDNTGVSQDGTAHLGKMAYGVGAKIQYGGFYVLGRIQGYESDAAYGQIYLLPDEDYDNRIKQPNHHIEMGYKSDVGKWVLDAKVGYRYNSLFIKSLVAPPGFVFPSLTNPPAAVTFTNGYESEFTSVQQQGYQSTTVSYNGFENHHISAGYRISYEKTTSVEAYGTDRNTGTGTVELTNVTPPTIPGSHRFGAAAVIGDEILLADMLSVNLAVNAEKNTQYDKFIVDPKASLVYRVTNSDILKLIYTKSHRNPAWQELYSAVPGSKVGNPDLKPETVDMFEVAYVNVIEGQGQLQANAFYLHNKNQISNENPDSEYRNAYGSKIGGFELEVNTRIGDSDRIYASYSYAVGKVDKGGELCQMPNHMVKGYYVHKLTKNLTVGAVMKYIGEKKRSEYDARDNLSSHTTFDLSLNYKEPYSGIVGNVALKNAFNETYALPSSAYTYVDDYRQPGRNVAFTLRKNF